MGSSSAFTLVELLVVVVVISIIVAGVSISSRQTTRGLALEAETKRIAGVLECAGEYARHNRVSLSVCFDVRDGVYWLSFPAVSGDGTGPPHSWTRKRQLPRGLNYGRVEIGGERVQDAGSLDIAGDGRSLGAIIELATSDGVSSKRILVSPGGGLVEVRDLEPSPSLPPPAF